MLRTDRQDRFTGTLCLHALVLAWTCACMPVLTYPHARIDVDSHAHVSACSWPWKPVDSHAHVPSCPHCMLMPGCMARPLACELPVTPSVLLTSLSKTYCQPLPVVVALSVIELACMRISKWGLTVGILDCAVKSPRVSHRLLRKCLYRWKSVAVVFQIVEGRDSRSTRDNDAIGGVAEVCLTRLHTRFMGFWGLRPRGSTDLTM